MKRLTLILLWLLFLTVSGQEPKFSRVDSLYNYARSLVISQTLEGDSVSKRILRPLAMDARHEDRLDIQAQCYHLLGFAHEKNNTDSSLYYLEKAAAVYLEIESSGYIDANNFMGYTYVDHGDFSLSLAAFQRSLDFAEAKNDSSAQAYVLSELGYVYDRMEDYQMALNYYTKALAYSTDSSTTAIIIGKKGIAHDELEEFDSAIYYNTIAIAYFEALNERMNQSVWLSNLGNTYTKVERWDDALEVLLQSEFIAKEEGNTAPPFLSVNLGKTYLEKGNYEESLKYINRGINDSKEAGLVRSLYEGYYMLHQWHKAKNNPAKALNYYQQYAELRDSIINEDRLKDAQELQLKYESEKKDREIAEATASLSEKGLMIERERVKFLVAGGALILFLGIGSWIFYAQRQRRLRIAQQYEHEAVIASAENEQKLSEQKLRISRELHDNIGSQITLMVSSLDNMAYRETGEESKNHLNKIAAFGRDAMIDLRNTIWAIKEQDANTLTLVNKVIDLKSRINPPPEIEIINKCTKSVNLNAVEVLNAFRIIQESIQNAIKYAEAKNIAITFSDEHIRLAISIKDNGIGFDTSTTELGNGLQNMHARAEAIAGKLSITSNLSEGTEVLLKLNK